MTVQLMHPRGVQRTSIGTTLRDIRSTHAPAWGATALQDAHTRDQGRSTHAPAWGATVLLKSPR